MSPVTGTTTILPSIATETPASGWMLVVGPAAAQVAPRIAARIPCQTSGAESILEAILISSQVAGLVLIDVASETEHLESALRSLRGINPDARIVLLCEPLDEPPCRRAIAWGADDYELLPLDEPAITRLARQVTPVERALPPQPAETVPASASHSYSALSGLADLPAIPLLMQTEMLEEVLGGNPSTPESDFPQRTTASLARHLHIQGSLQYLPATPDAAVEEPKPGEYRRPIVFAGQPFGTLLWQPQTLPGAHSPSPAETGILAQAAHWLATMLALAQRLEQLRVLAITDELSGAYNRRYFMTYMHSLLERSREKRSRITLLLFDIDDFKRYNDTFGHGSGDAIIRELIKLLRLCTRPKDLVARVGGDEFAVVYWDNEPPRQPNSDHPKEILAATERFRRAIEKHAWPETCNIKGTISISGGLASFPWDADTLDTLMAKADEALLQAKRAGKNVIVLHNKMGNGGTGTSPDPQVPQV